MCGKGGEPGRGGEEGIRMRAPPAFASKCFRASVRFSKSFAARQPMMDINSPVFAFGPFFKEAPGDSLFEPVLSPYEKALESTLSIFFGLLLEENAGKSHTGCMQLQLWHQN